MLKQTFMTSAVLFSVSLVAAQAHSSLTPTDQAQRTIHDIRESAYNVENDSDTLQSFATNTMISSEARADLLNQMQARINHMGKEIADLEAERGALAPWEQQALDEMVPLLKNAAENTQHVIDYFNSRKDPTIWSAQYREDTARVTEDAEKVVKELSASLKTGARQ